MYNKARSIQIVKLVEKGFIIICCIKFGLAIIVVVVVCSSISIFVCNEVKNKIIEFQPFFFLSVQC